MKYCNRCLYPANHPLNITFDKEGVCSGCRVHEEKDTLDWTKRFEKLKKIVVENTNYHHPLNNGKNYYTFSYT